MSAPNDPNQPDQPPPPPPQQQPPPPPPPVPQQPPPAAPPPAAPPAAAQPAAALPVEGWEVKRSVVRVVVLLIVSFGFYVFYWFYKTRQKVTAELGTYDNVGGQTIGLVVPILNWFIIYWLLRDVHEARRRMGLQTDMEPIIMLVIWLVFSPVGLALTQSQLNEYWDVRSQGYARDAPLTFGEIAIGVVPGLFFFAFWIVLIIIIAAASSTSDVILPLLL
jgi:hypothetical protein